MTDISINELRRDFLSPADEYTPMPFWFWNDDLTDGELTRQIDDFRAHGVMGFVIHPRKGLTENIGYMSEEYLRLVRHAVEEAARRGMRVMLYDEGMYPSGSAHGMVVAENPDWAARCLWMERAEGEVAQEAGIVAVCAAHVDGDRASGVTLLSPENGLYCAPADGRSLLVFREGFSHGTIRGLYPGEDDGEPNAPAAADLMNPEAMQAFIRLTHEKYYAAMPEHFGRTVIAMFTDEPDLTGRNARRGALPWTAGFLPEFGDPAELPALFLDMGGGTQTIRRRYRQAVSARLLRTYYQPLADWCAAHRIALTGHPSRGYEIGLLAPFQMPGQDLVWRQVTPGSSLMGPESVMARCCSDSARHAGKRRCSCEYLGCCGPADSPWAMTPADLKWYTDFLLARGVNLLIPHAFYYSVRDERAQERPPDVGPNNTWWPHFGQFAAYMRRMSFLLTDSVDQARTAVLCEGDRMPWACCAPLYEHQAGFCYLEASLLPECRVEDGALCIREQRYTHLVIDDVPLTGAQQGVVEAFRAAGGTVVDGAEVAGRIGEFPAPAVMPRQPGLRVTHLTRGGAHLYLLFNEGETPVRGHVSPAETGCAEWWDAWEGTTVPAHPAPKGYPIALMPRESIILCIDPNRPVLSVQEPAPEPTAVPLRAHAWRLTREDSLTCTLHADGTRLPGWETIPGWADYSGMVAYETILEHAGGMIDLGEVHEIARLWADGEYLGCRLWPPYAFPLPEKPGPIRLRAEITNTPANRMDGVARPSGLMGEQPDTKGE